MNIVKITKIFPTTYLFIAFFFSGYTFAQPFTGEWDWNSAPSTRTFSIKLKQKGNRLYGQYCAVAQNGNKIDCDDEEDINIVGYIDNTGKSSIVKFSSFFDAKNGKAKISINGENLFWRIIKNPEGGEFYAPKDAILVPH